MSSLNRCNIRERTLKFQLTNTHACRNKRQHVFRFLVRCFLLRLGRVTHKSLNYFPTAVISTFLPLLNEYSSYMSRRPINPVVCSTMCPPKRNQQSPSFHPLTSICTPLYRTNCPPHKAFSNFIAPSITGTRLRQFQPEHIRDDIWKIVIISAHSPKTN